MTAPRVLVAGIGNIFLGDDAFGVEVAQRLIRRRLPDEVRVVDFGIRGLDLAYALLDGYETAILVDAVPRGGPPGTLYVIEPELGSADAGSSPASITFESVAMHGMDPVKVLQMAQALGGNIRQVLLVGCEPQPLGPDGDVPLGLSASVQASVDEAVRLVESLVAWALGGRYQQTV